MRENLNQEATMDEDRKTFYIGTEVDPSTGQAGAPVPVSYTHLTLPTIYSV